VCSALLLEFSFDVIVSGSRQTTALIASRMLLQAPSQVLRRGAKCILGGQDFCYVFNKHNTKFSRNENAPSVNTDLVLPTWLTYFSVPRRMQYAWQSTPHADIVQWFESGFSTSPSKKLEGVKSGALQIELSASGCLLSIELSGGFAYFKSSSIAKLHVSVQTCKKLSFDQINVELDRSFYMTFVGLRLWLNQRTVSPSLFRNFFCTLRNLVWHLSAG